LFGDAFTWLGLALLTYEISPDNAAAILASALTLRVTAYIIFSPFAGVVSEKLKRKNILLITQLARMAIVCMLPFVNAEWQVWVDICIERIRCILHANIQGYYPTDSRQRNIQGSQRLINGNFSVVKRIWSCIGGDICGMVRSQADFLCQWSNIIHCHTTDIDYTGGSTAKRSEYR
jgi:hypothetical protein